MDIHKFWGIPVFLFILILGNIPAWAEEDKMLTLCESGNSTACFKRGQQFLTLERDKKKAIEVFRKACASDHMTACTWGGALIQNTGTQYSKQWKEAAKMFNKACDAGEDASCFNLGALKYKEGRKSSAIKYFQKACDLDNIVGCDNVKWLNK